MQIMGTNRWENDFDRQMLITQALRFADAVKEQGIAELRDAWIATDDKLLWCTWDTKDLAALQEAFRQMNDQSGLTSELTGVDRFYSPTAVSPT